MPQLVDVSWLGSDAFCDAALEMACFQRKPELGVRPMCEAQVIEIIVKVFRNHGATQNAMHFSRHPPGTVLSSSGVFEHGWEASRAYSEIGGAGWCSPLRRV